MEMTIMQVIQSTWRGAATVIFSMQENEMGREKLLVDMLSHYGSLVGSWGNFYDVMQDHNLLFCKFSL